MLQKCNLIKFLEEEAAWGAHKRPGTGEVRALRSSLSSCPKPSRSIPEIPSQHTLLHLPALWDPKWGEKPTQHHFRGHALPAALCCEASFLFNHPHRPAMQVRCKSHLPGLFFPNTHAPVAASSAFPGFSRSCQELNWQLPAPGCNWENAPTRLQSCPGTHSWFPLPFPAGLGEAGRGEKEHQLRLSLPSNDAHLPLKINSM